jgi:ATP-dependent RNA helicase RhlE
MTFSEITHSPILLKNLTRNKFTTPTPIQAQAIPPALEGRNVLATAQTGTGKTLAFTLPILELLGKQPLAAGPQALVLSPTRELAMQIHETFDLVAQGTGIRAVAVVGGMSENAQLKSMRRGAQVIIATPGRLQDFLDRNLIALAGVRIAVLDEADRMLDMGFLPAVEAILRRTMEKRQTMCFSATMESAVSRLAERHCRDAVRIAVGGSSLKPAERIDMHVYEVEPDRKVALLNHLLDTHEGSFLVFARTKRGTERLAKKLSVTHKATAIHGDRSQNQRNAALRGFQEGQYRVLVATDVAARGIHVDNVAQVVNFDLPQQAEDFVHRVGRTGRAGARGVASTFALREERRDVAAIEKAISVRLTVKPTPEGLAREERRGAAVIEMPAKERVAKYVASRTQSFRPRGRRAGR